MSIICVDFDGTIVDHCYPDIGEPVPGAIEWLTKFQNKGIKLVLWTMRSDCQQSGPMLDQAVRYLKQNQLVFWKINENPQTWTVSPKAYGHLYIDDAAVGCPLIKLPFFKRECVDWSKVGPEVEHRLGL